MFDSLRPSRLQPTRLLCLRGFPGKNTGVGCHLFLQGIFLTQGLNLYLLHWQMILYCWVTREALVSCLSFWQYCTFVGFFAFIYFLFIFILLFNFTILYWFCHILKWIRLRYTCVPHSEPSSLLPPHTIPLGHPSAPAPSIQYHASNLDWWLIS